MDGEPHIGFRTASWDSRTRCSLPLRPRRSGQGLRRKVLTGCIHVLTIFKQYPVHFLLDSKPEHSSTSLLISIHSSHYHTPPSSIRLSNTPSQTPQHSPHPHQPHNPHRHRHHTPRSHMTTPHRPFLPRLLIPQSQRFFRILLPLVEVEQQPCSAHAGGAVVAGDRVAEAAAGVWVC